MRIITTGLVLRMVGIGAGLSQEELTARSEFLRGMIDKCERRERLPSLDVLIKLSKGLKMNASEIVRLLKKRVSMNID